MVTIQILTTLVIQNFKLNFLSNWALWLVHSFPSLMQNKPFTVFSLFSNVIKITFNYNMFRPYKAIFRQLFVNWNCVCQCTSLIALKCVCMRMNTLSSLRVIFILRLPCCASFMCRSHYLAYWGDQAKEDKLVWATSTYGICKKCIQNFVRNAWRESST
jgi:hypothetical protein